MKNILEELSKRNSEWLNMATKICGNRDQAKDLVQDMYIKLHDKDKDFSPGYVYLTLKSLFIDQTRVKSAVPDTVDLEEELSDNIDMDEQNYEAMILAFTGLKFHEREILRYSYIEGLKPFSRASGISVSTIQIIRKKYKEKVWQHLNERNQDSETLSSRLQEQLESALARAAKTEGINSTSCFLSIGLGR